MNVLVIAPHPDDESIGCGGTLCLHVERGDRVSAVFLTSGELGLKHLPPQEAWRVREKEAEEAARIMGLADLTFLRGPDWSVGEQIEQVGAALRSVLDSEMPQVVYLPHEAEWHPDHSAALAVLRSALSNSLARPQTLLAYEVWTPLQTYDQVGDISSTMRRKLLAVRCYKSQLRGFRYDRAVQGLNRYRGALAAKCPYAEVFQHVEVSPEGLPRGAERSGSG